MKDEMTIREDFGDLLPFYSATEIFATSRSRTGDTIMQNGWRNYRLRLAGSLVRDGR